MKREFTLKTIAVIAAIFAATALFAQGTALPGWDDGAAGSNYDTLPASTYMIEGATIPLAAKPDPYFHPSYSAATGGGITAGFTWTWSEGSTTLIFSQNDQNDNYVELTAPAGSNGSYTVNVVANSPYGSCNDGGTNIAVEVVTAPALAYTAISVDSVGCEGTTFPDPIAVTVSGGYQAYRLAWSLEIKSTDSGGTETWYDDENGTGPSGTSKYAVEYTQAAPEAVAASGDHTITTVGAFNAINSETTEYIYTISGVNDQASRWSDFLTLAAGVGVNSPAADAFTYYDTGDETITITVHPTPVTGPIYHIESTWAN